MRVRRRATARSRDFQGCLCSLAAGNLTSYGAERLILLGLPDRSCDAARIYDITHFPRRASGCQGSR